MNEKYLLILAALVMSAVILSGTIVDVEHSTELADCRQTAMNNKYATADIEKLCK